MRIVLDTNILARATPRDRASVGLARELLERSILPPNLLVISEYLLSELSRTLRYPRLQSFHRLSAQEIEEYVGDVRSASLVVELSSSSAPVVVEDPKDDPIIATAVTGAADVLCTRDKHILASPSVVQYCSGFGVRVVDDITLIQMLRAGP